MKNLKVSDFTFTNSGRDIERYLTEEAPKPRKALACFEARQTKYRSFPANRFRRIGASVYSYANGFMVDFSRVLVAGSLDDDFIQNILTDHGTDLVKAPQRAVWTIRKVGSKKFFITRKEV